MLLGYVSLSISDCSSVVMLYSRSSASAKCSPSHHRTGITLVKGSRHRTVIATLYEHDIQEYYTTTTTQVCIAAAPRTSGSFDLEKR